MTFAPEVVPAGDFQTNFYWDQIAGWSNDSLRVGWRLEGRLPDRRLASALYALFARHEALRTTLTLRNGVLQQVIWPPSPPSIIDVSTAAGLPCPEGSAVSDTLTTQLNAPFDMTGPLTRIVRLRASSREQALFLVMHHTITDLESCYQLESHFRELLDPSVFDGALSSPYSGQFRDYVRWERSVAAVKHTDYWRQRMVRSDVLLPVVDELDETGTILAESQEVVLSAAHVHRLGELASRHRCTLATTIFAAAAAALSPWFPKKLRLGVSYANRIEPGFKSIVGPLASILPITVRTEARTAFTELVNAVRTEWIGALQHRVPLGVLRELSGRTDWSCHGIADILINIFSPPPPQLKSRRDPMSRLKLETPRLNIPAPRTRVRTWSGGAVPCMLVFAIDPSGSLGIRIVTDPRGFAAPASSLLAHHIAETLRAVADTPGIAIGRCPAPPADIHSRP